VVLAMSEILEKQDERVNDLFIIAKSLNLMIGILSKQQPFSANDKNELRTQNKRLSSIENEIKARRSVFEAIEKHAEKLAMAEKKNIQGDKKKVEDFIHYQ
jgi:hypothetical protein